MSRHGLCAKCEGTCCRYVALPIETPETKREFDDVRWYLAHKGVEVFVEKGDWYIHFASTCRHLHPSDHTCDIYEKRPRICRDYRTGKCDMSEGDYDHEFHFTSDAQFEEYIRTRFAKKTQPKRTARKRK